MITAFGTWTKIISAWIIRIEILMKCCHRISLNLLMIMFVDKVRSIVSSECHKCGNLLK